MSPAEPEIRFVEAGGTRVRVSVAGIGPPLLLMAGIGGNIEMWEPLTRLLGHRRLIAFDAPGAGATPPLRGRVRMARLADVVAELVDRLGCGRVDVLGYSFGGALAQQFARDHPQRVRRLILAGTLPGLGGAQHPARMFQLLRLARTRDEHERAVRVARLVGGRSGRDSEVLAGYERNRLAQSPTAAGHRHQMRTIAGWSSVTWLRTLKAPTLVLAGEEDPMIPLVNSRLLCRLIPDCRRHVVPGAGHLFLLDQPEDVAPVIDGFLGDAVSARRLFRRRRLRWRRRRSTRQSA